jgi:hypothetical protein
MGRPRKMQEGRSRSFLLPNDLLEQIEAAAEKRDLDASDVVRELLQKNIKAYLAESDLVWQERLRDAIDSAKKDPAVLDLFLKYRDRKQLVLPLDTGLKQPKLLLLMEALKAHRLLQDIEPDRSVPGVHPLLQEMAETANEKARESLRLVTHLDSAGLMRVTRQEDGSIDLEVRSEVIDSIKAKDLSEPDIETLSNLIDQKVLRRRGSKGKREVFRFHF